MNSLGGWRAKKDVQQATEPGHAILKIHAERESLFGLVSAYIHSLLAIIF